LTELGEKIRELLQYEARLYREIIHFLHYQGYDYTSRRREYLWSYRKLCELLWNRTKVGRHNDLAAKVTGCIQEHFNTTHVPFDGTIIGKFLTWIKPLEPQIIDDICKVFFMSPICFNDLMDMSKRFYSDHLRLMTGFQGTSLILKKSFSVTDLI